MSDQPIRLFDLTREELRAQMTAWGQPAYRAAQVRQWLYKQLATDPAEMTSLPAALRARLAEEAQIELLEPVTESRSRDGETTKTLFRLHDGHLIETVLMRYRRRRTVCISSQAGCAMGCTFCATARMGLQRNLTPGEIVAQVLYFERKLRITNYELRITNYESGTGSAEKSGSASRITNVVVMGMGEPLANYSNLWAALRTLTAEDGFGLGARRITVSTVGLAPAIDRFAGEDLQIGLAISLHAPDDELRASLAPVNRRYPIGEVMDAARRYVDRTRRRITFEYALMRDINDSRETAEALAGLLKGLLCHVNLIPLNPIQDSPYQPSRGEDAEAFAEILESHGIPATLRVRRGIDIDAGCGQLRARIAAATPDAADAQRRASNPLPKVA